MKPLTRLQRTIAYGSLGFVIGWALVGLFFIGVVILGP